MINYLNYNGRFFSADAAVLPANNMSYRYGDGVFETMKVANGNILFAAYHFERLFSGMEVLKFKVPSLFTVEKIRDEVKALCQKNNCERLARIRFSVSRGNGGLYDCDNNFSYLIECWPLEEKVFNETGLVIDIFPDARKSNDVFSNLKSANYLPYIMAAVWAKENKLNDALILNQHGRICDATIANVFWVKGNKIFTPPLTEGCVAGVMRRRILDLGVGISDLGLNINESVLTEEILLKADEVFLTNVITGIRWVKQFRVKTYNNQLAGKLLGRLSSI